MSINSIYCIGSNSSQTLYSLILPEVKFIIRLIESIEILFV